MTPQLVMGELVGVKPDLHDLPCDVPGVRARGTVHKFKGRVYEKRLYECVNGWALGAKRGGPLDFADADSWEVFTFNPRRIVVGEPGGWIGEEQLLRLVALLATWFDEPAEATA